MYRRHTCVFFGHPAVLCVRVGARERGAGQQHPRRRKERDKERQSLRVPHLGDDQRHFHRLHMVLLSMVKTIFLFTL